MDAPTHQENPGGLPLGQPKTTSRWQVVGCLITGVTFCLLVVISVVAWSRQTSPAVVARQYLSEQGVATDNLELVGYNSFSYPFPGLLSSAKVEFRVKGADLPKKLVVELFRPVYFIPWYGTAFREQVEK